MADSEEIAAHIRRRIVAGELRPGERVPSTRQITRRWGVAMATATRVLATLQREGLVIARPGIGTVVAPRPEVVGEPGSGGVGAVGAGKSGGAREAGPDEAGWPETAPTAGTGWPAKGDMGAAAGSAGAGGAAAGGTGGAICGTGGTTGGAAGAAIGGGTGGAAGGAGGGTGGGAATGGGTGGAAGAATGGGTGGGTGGAAGAATGGGTGGAAGGGTGRGTGGSGADGGTGSAAVGTTGSSAGAAAGRSAGGAVGAGIGGAVDGGTGGAAGGSAGAVSDGGTGGAAAGTTGDAVGGVAGGSAGAAGGGVADSAVDGAAAGSAGAAGGVTSGVVRGGVAGAGGGGWPPAPGFQPAMGHPRFRGARGGLSTGAGGVGGGGLRGGAARRGVASELGREDVVRVAVAIADVEGSSALSMRRVATELGVATMSLYRHVSSKDDLVVQMLDAVFGDHRFEVAAPDDWLEALAVAARRLWAIFRRHPWAAPVMSVTRPQVTPHVLAYSEWVMGVLQGTGLSGRQVFQVHLTLFSYVRGLAVSLEPEVLAEQETGHTYREFIDQQDAMMVALISSGAYPAFQAVVSGADFDLDLDEQFEFGLRHLLDGLAGLPPGDPRPRLR